MKFLLTVVLSIIIYYRPIYSLFAIIVFYAEYFYFINYLLNIYSHYSEYYCIKIDKVDVSDMSFIEIWLEYCKIHAFQRVYILPAKKKISIRAVITTLSIIFFSIPFKVLRLWYYLIIINKRSLRDGFELLYLKAFNIVKHCKIEVLNRKIYLNCFTLGKIISKLNILKNNDMQILSVLKEVQEAVIKFDDIEKKKDDHSEFVLSSAKDKKGKLIYSPHYTINEKGNTVHATSYVPDNLSQNQKNTLPMPELIKEGSKNPGSVITKDIGSLEKSNRKIFVPTHEIERIKFENPDLFNLNEESQKYHADKELVFTTILKDLKDFDQNLINELCSNNYNITLLHASDNDMINEISNARNQYDV